MTGWSRTTNVIDFLLGPDTTDKQIFHHFTLTCSASGVLDRYTPAYQWQMLLQRRPNSLMVSSSMRTTPAKIWNPPQMPNEWWAGPPQHCHSQRFANSLCKSPLKVVQACCSVWRRFQLCERGARYSLQPNRLFGIFRWPIMGQSCWFTSDALMNVFSVPWKQFTHHFLFDIIKTNTQNTNEN